MQEASGHKVVVARSPAEQGTEAREFATLEHELTERNQVRALDLGSCSSALHSEDTKGYVIPPGQPGKKDRNIENEKTNFFVGVPKLCGLNTDANPHIQNQKHCDSRQYWTQSNTVPVGMR
eukprot:scaffold126_cov142-Skeletonema_marinoi.AAC.4